MLAAERAIDEVRCGRPVAVAGALDLLIYAPVETISPQVVEDLRGIGNASMSLVISGERALALGARGATRGASFTLPLPGDATLSDMVRWATSDRRHIIAEDDLGLVSATAERAPDQLIVRLLKAAWLLPAAVRVTAAPMPAVTIQELLVSQVLHTVSVGGLQRFFDTLDNSVVKVSEARIPLADAAEARFVCFRTAVASREHLAIVIGAPDEVSGVPVRLHSACLTGDVFGSLRCDCGDQLRQSIAALQVLGGGVLLYLAQEGRGIGLANKLRAYALQDDGRDTIDADLQLGFSPDERQYGVAAAMLRALGFERIRLMTNNPEKIEALGGAGITIVDRLPLLASITPENQRYMDAKRIRAHHLLDPAGG